MEQTYSYLKNRTEFGKHCFFRDRGPELCDSIPPDRSLQQAFILTNPVDHGILVTTNLSNNSTNTTIVDTTTSGVNHVEGGWPKEVNINEEEAAMRYQKKCLKEDSYYDFLSRLHPDVERILNSNNAVDNYQLYFNEIDPMQLKEIYNITTMNIYKDPRCIPIPIVSLNWTMDNAKIVAGHADKAFHNGEAPGNHCYVWDIENPGAPLVTLEAHCEMFKLATNPKDVNSIVCGLKSGQVGSFDLRVKTSPTLISLCHSAHCSPVSDILFINSKTSSEFFSSGSDGYIKWWDFRFLAEPTETLLIDPPSKGTAYKADPNRALGVSCLEYETKIPSKFLCGTEDGRILSINRKGKAAIEIFSNQYKANAGPIAAIERNRGVSKVFLSVEEWQLRIWSEDSKDSSVCWTVPSTDKISDAAWSAGRFSIFATAMEDGSIHVWDLLKKQTMPIVKVQLSNSVLTKIIINETGNNIMAGGNTGSVYLTSVSDNLTTSTSSERNTLTNFFDLEAKREKAVAAIRQAAVVSKHKSEESDDDDGYRTPQSF